jgi:heptosyltransferase III
MKMHIMLSRTDSIGDVVLTLPMAGLIREKYPDARITFIGRSYTEPVIKLSKHIDGFINRDHLEKLEISARIKALRELHVDWIIHVFPDKALAREARRAGISNRVGTSHRIFHWLNCNKRVSFSRRKSDLHEAQLNCKLLAPLDITIPKLENIHTYYGVNVPGVPVKRMKSLIDQGRKNIVLHPKSKGSAREWGLENFHRLIQLLPADDFKIFITGTLAEAGLMKEFLEKNEKRITDLTGKLTLEEFIAFLSLVDGIVAASTGPLHIAAALGRQAIGIYPPIHPMHPGRWAPLGVNAKVLVKATECEECRKSMDCHCIREIKPEEVSELINKNL